MKFVLASSNNGKIAEIQSLLRDYLGDGVEVLSLSDVGLQGDIEENGSTFEENAVIKAQYAATSGYIGIADDSGLVVPALGGEPGIHSARYATDHDDKANNEKLLKELEGIGDRSAAFVCCMACVVPGGFIKPITAHGYVEGEILITPRGEGGFGYDPLFWVDQYGKTFAEMSAEEKNAISHRKMAIEGLAVKLRSIVNID